jgi:hypothetical protein
MKNALEKAKSEMDAVTKAAQAEARSRTKTAVNETLAKVEISPAVAPAQSAEPVKADLSKPASLFDPPASYSLASVEDDSTGREEYTCDPDDSEELDDAA